MTPKGINAFIVPKALTFASNWQQIRDFLKQDLTQVIDCRRAWSYVLLEMIIFIRHRQSFCDAYKTGFLNADSQIAQSFFVEKKYIELFRLYPNDLTPQEFDLGLRICQGFDKLGEKCENVRGVTYQKFLKSKEKMPFYGGKQIGRYVLKKPKGYISNLRDIPKNAFCKENAILIQNIVAHIKEPTPHIKITACLSQKETLILDTLNQLTFRDLNHLLMLGLLNSKFISWYVYKFIFANAIRTMHFDSPISSRIPIPKITKQNQKIADKIIANIEQILKIKENDSQANTQSLESEIDSLVYELYSLTDEEISLIEK